MTKYVKISGKVLESLMQERAFDQSYLSKKSDVNRTTINHVINGRVKRVHCKTARAFAEALDVPVSELIEIEREV